MSTKPKPEGNAKPEPFEKVTENGRAVWVKTQYLRNAESILDLKMQRIENIEDREIQSAFLALETSRLNLLRLEKEGDGLAEIYGEDYLSDHRTGREEILWAIQFLLPLAKRLLMPRPVGVSLDDWKVEPSTKEEAKMLRKDACKFVSGVIDRMFSEHLMKPQRPTIRAKAAIPLALRYCQKLDRLPTKKELGKHLTRVPGGEFALNDTDYRGMLRLAGLDGLPPDKSGRPKNTL